MKRNILALMDSEPGYAMKFMTYVNRRKSAPFDVHAFTDRCLLQSYIRSHLVSVLLISEKDFTGEEQAWPVRQVILLTESVRDGMEERQICKYQSSTAVMREAARIFGEETEGRETPGGEEKILKIPTKMIGIFSPAGRCGKTSFALAMGQILARTRPTAFLSMEASPGLEYLLHTEFSGGLADAVYYIRGGERNIVPRILPLLKEVGGMYLLPPFPDARELYGVSAEEWHLLLASLRLDSSYECIVLDLGSLPMVHPEILEECDIIYEPQVSGIPEMGKRAGFHDLLERTDTLRTRERTRMIDLGEPGEGLSPDRWIELLPFGLLGKAAGECIERDSLA